MNATVREIRKMENKDHMIPEHCSLLVNNHLFSASAELHEAVSLEVQRFAGNIEKHTSEREDKCGQAIRKKLVH